MGLAWLRLIGSAGIEILAGVGPAFAQRPLRASAGVYRNLARGDCTISGESPRTDGETVYIVRITGSGELEQPWFRAESEWRDSIYG